MLGKTSISAIRTLILLAQQDPTQCWSPRRLAETLGESPTYLAKVVRHLVKRGILEAERGVKGGVRLVVSPADVSLLAIVEACQGEIVGNFCKSSRPDPGLARWTLDDLLQQPSATDFSHGLPCMMGRELQAGGPSLTRLEAGR
jgi:Rrf2 family protein